MISGRALVLFASVLCASACDGCSCGAKPEAGSSVVTSLPELETWEKRGDVASIENALRDAHCAPSLRVDLVMARTRLSPANGGVDAGEAMTALAALPERERADIVRELVGRLPAEITRSAERLGVVSDAPRAVAEGLLERRAFDAGVELGATKHALAVWAFAHLSEMPTRLDAVLRILVEWAEPSDRREADERLKALIPRVSAPSFPGAHRDSLRADHKRAKLDPTPEQFEATLLGLQRESYRALLRMLLYLDREGALDVARRDARNADLSSDVRAEAGAMLSSESPQNALSK